MAIQNITPEDVQAVLEGDSEFVYLDVRSIPEFDQGHPEKAYNVPLMNFDAVKQKLSANPDFEQVVKANFKKSQRIILGCKSGARSLRAAEVLEGLGYLSLCNMVGGFAGGEDENGEPLPGWMGCNLPVGRMTLTGRGYDSLSDGLV